MPGARTVVYCDFDGTISVGDTVDVLLEKLADPAWREIEERWVRGEIGSRECMGQQIPLIRGGWQAIRQVLDGVQLEPSFLEFVRWCRSERIPLLVVSEGLDKVINYLLAREGIRVDGLYANHLVQERDGSLRLEFPMAPTNGTCRAGLCKCKILGNSCRVVIGDGLSDVCWSKEADLLFAKKKLLSYCVDNQIAHRPFSDFYDIRTEIEEHRRSVLMPAALSLSA